MGNLEKNGNTFVALRLFTKYTGKIEECLLSVPEQSGQVCDIVKSDTIGSVAELFNENEFVWTSVSSCLENIVRRNIPLDKVKYIIGNTKCTTRNEFESLVKLYARPYRSDIPWVDADEYIRVWLALWDTWKILQYRIDEELLWRVLGNKKNLPEWICRIGASSVRDVYGEDITLAS